MLMNTRLAQFVHGLYFDIQTIEGVQPLEIWNGIRELSDPYEKTSLVKNLYKIAMPLVNTKCYGRPFALHSRRARATVDAVLDWFSKDPEARIFERFPYPPTGDADQKEVYRLVKARTAALLEEIDAAEGTAPGEPSPGTIVAPSMFPDSLFDFREMRVIDNELPYIIFTDKEFRVIHGLAIVYLWLVDLGAIFLATLKESGVDNAIIDEYRQFERRMQKEQPLTIRGRRMDATELIAHIHEKLQYEDYLDLFETVYGWFEQARTKSLGQ
jgi:hypothetical protein